MQTQTSASAAARATPRVVERVDSGAVGAWTLGFALIVYLGLKGGGYDVVIRSEVGVAAWWIVLLGALVGALPLRRLGRGTWAVFGFLAAFGGWSLLGIAWSESSERTVLETGRLAMMLGVFALAVAVCTPERLRSLVSGVAVGTVAIAGVAVASRVQPEWFSAEAGQTGQFLLGTSSRLAYPINYWNGLAALVALGLPLVLVSAAGARSLVARCVATAALPLLLLCWYLTLSRGGALAIVMGVVAFLVLTSRRGAAMVALVLGAAGSAILIAGVEQRPALGDGLTTALSRHQGDEMTVLVLVVCGGVALIRLAAGMAQDHGLMPSARFAAPAARTRNVVVVVVVAAGILVAVAAGGAGDLSARWEAFKNPELGLTQEQADSAGRFTSSSGHGRYQFWRAAVHAFEAHPIGGSGAGTFEFWWARHATMPGFVRNAHSLYFETLAETGAIGLLLLLGVFGSLLIGGVSRLRQAEREQRALLAAATAGCVAFAASAAVDWVWQIAVLPVAFLLLAAALLSGTRSTTSSPPRRLPRVVAVVVAVGALVVLAVPLSGVVSVRESQAAAGRRDLPAALASAQSAVRLQPYAGTPELQRALVLELDGDLDAAARAARAAERREPTNWRPPLVLARIETERGNVAAGLVALRRAKSLNRASLSLR